MKKLLCWLLCLVIARAAPAQPATEFVKAINDLLKAAPKVDWAGTSPVAIDSAFHLIGDSLTYTLSYRTKSESFRVRFVAPFSRIERLENDYYLILLFPANQVNIYKQLHGASWALEEQSSMMHIARIEDVPPPVRVLREKAERAFAKWKGK